MLLLDIANGWKTAIMIVAMIVVFYLFLIRPQTQQEKKERAYRENLKSGDRVMTAGGIHVTFISSQPGGLATVEIASGVRVKLLLSTLQPIPVPQKKK